ncbi:MAG: helix-turn-helix transcriptional regulator [Bacteroidetes bacterium]|nr:helix-turn-helix transcriptional regulator [Bacteroidota bacterium]
MSTITLKNFKKKAFTNSEVKKEYDSFASAYELRKKLIRLRKQAGLTQEEMAKLLNTKKSNISRLENVNSKISPTILTIEKYAKVIGYNLEINFLPLS